MIGEGRSSVDGARVNGLSSAVSAPSQRELRALARVKAAQIARDEIRFAKVLEAGRSYTPGLVQRVAVLAVLAVALGIFIRSALFESFFIRSTSMTPTLHPDDHVVVAKMTYGLRMPLIGQRVVTWSAPRRGEVVVFTRRDDPATFEDESQSNMVKRVIGVAGDTVTISGKMVVVNGERIQEPYARWNKDGSGAAQSFTVPSGGVFVLGDNRDESFDSRFWKQPFVEVAQVIGPVAAVY